MNGSPGKKKKKRKKQKEKNKRKKEKMSNVVWNAVKGWHDGEKVSVALEGGRIVSTPEKMIDRRGEKIEKIDAEKNEVHLETGEVVQKNICDVYLGGEHHGKDCIDHYRPWL